MAISLLIDTSGGSNFEANHLRNVLTLHVGGSALASETLDVTGTVGVSDTLKVNTIAEFGTGVGVTVDGVVIKDSGATFGGDIVVKNGFGVIIGHTAVLAIAGTTPELQVLGTADADSSIAIGRYSADVTPGALRFYKSRAAIGSLATVVTGDEVGAIRAFGDDGTDADTASSAIIFDTEGTISTGQVPGIIRIQVAAAGTLADAVTIDSAKAVVLLGAVTVTGRLLVDDTTQATTTTDGSLQTDGGLSVVKNAVITTMTLATGSITDSSGAISFGNENLSTTGTLAAGATTVTGDLVVSDQVTVGGAIEAGSIFNIEPGVAQRDMITSIGLGLHIEADTWDINAAGNSETKAVGALAFFGIPTWNSTGTSFVVTSGATVYIEGAPVGNTNVTVSNAYSLNVAAGTSRFFGSLELGASGSASGILYSTESIFLNVDSDDGQSDKAIIFGKDREGTSGGTELGRITEGSLFFLGGDTSNPNMTIGLTINQGGSDDQILCLKSSDVATVVTTLPVSAFDVQTDDYLTIGKEAAATGGVHIVALAQTDAGASNLVLEALGGVATTTDTTSSVGLVNFIIGEHDGANAARATAADDNAFSIQVVDDAATLTRLLLKADDGELHLGNSTVAGLDEEDDIGAVRGTQMILSKGVGIVATEWDERAYSYEDLRRINVVGEKDDNGEFLIRVQPYFAMHDGALWQAYQERQELLGRIKEIERKMLAA